MSKGQKAVLEDNKEKVVFLVNRVIIRKQEKFVEMLVW